jgi:two-component system NtrC family sensor kinase
MRRNSLKFKVSLYLALVLSAAVLLFTFIFFHQRQEELQSVISGQVTQITETIVASTRYTMMVNERDIAEKIVDDIAKQKNIVRLRVISKDGTIIHSKNHSEIGYSVEQSDEPCVQCHLNAQPLKTVPDDKRWKIIDTGEGPRVMGAMHAIRNEPSCSNASCHEHPANQTVLGIVDVGYSLDEIDGAMKTHVVRFIGISLVCILVLSLSVSVMLRRLVYVPLNDLEAGALRVSAGDFHSAIPVHSDDDFGRVAKSFNAMTVALQESHVQVQEMVESLESKVQARTKELMEARAAVVQGEKLASVGVFASGIAHELNNPLTGVLTFTSLMRKKTPDGTEDAQDLDLVIRETKRCASIIKRLLDFAREKTPASGWYDLNRVIEDTVRIIDRPASLQKISMECQLDPALPQVWGDPDLIKQVVMNLLVNAQQAIDDKTGGSVQVLSRKVDANHVEVVVIDSGCGIPPAHMERIFDPFFTSKEVGKGTGLGLSVSYGIVRAHGGKISVESEVGQGSTFRVLLPVEASKKESESPGTVV